MNHALVIDHDVDSAKALAALMAGERYTVACAHTLRDARRQMALQQPDIVLLDLQLRDGSGMELLNDASLINHAEVVLVTGQHSAGAVMPVLRGGAASYLVKPVKLSQLQGVLSRFMKPTPLKAALREPTDPADTRATNGRFGHLWGRAPVMLRLYEQISRVAGTGVTVFITGESGSGKEVVAQTVHDLSRRSTQPFLAVNCGAVSPNLIESELFGHEKGSFTGAERQHPGYFERAAGGTLFLDEITEMPPALQVKLLRVLETGRYMRVGSTQTLAANVRVIAATNRDPLEAVAAGKLREDLMYRLHVFPIELPPLRDRLEDVPLLAAHFLVGIGEQEGHRKRLTPAALAQLASNPWPGNVRELRNAVQRAYVMAPGDEIDTQWLPNKAQPPQPVLAAPDAGSAATMLGLPIGTSLAEAERQLILATLQHHRQHKERTAAVLGISLKTLYNRLKEYAET